MPNIRPIQAAPQRCRNRAHAQGGSDECDAEGHDPEHLPWDLTLQERRNEAAVAYLLALSLIVFGVGHFLALVFILIIIVASHVAVALTNGARRRRNPRP